MQGNCPGGNIVSCQTSDYSQIYLWDSAGFFGHNFMLDLDFVGFIGSVRGEGGVAIPLKTPIFAVFISNKYSFKEYMRSMPDFTLSHAFLIKGGLI